MNGRTSIDATLNPATAEMDCRTWGCRGLNYSTYGSRLIRLHIGRLTIDVYSAKGGLFSAKGGGVSGTNRYRILFWPFGSIQWVTRKGR